MALLDLLYHGFKPGTCARVFCRVGLADLLDYGQPPRCCHFTKDAHLVIDALNLAIF